MTAPLVAVYGATGAVGRHTVAQLAAAGGVRLRVGGRSADRLATVPGAERLVVASDALAGFCRGAQLVINCAGPSSVLGDVVLRAALAAGADYVDAGGESLDGAVSPPARRMVLGAGLSPGLTGLAPRLLAAGATATGATAAGATAVGVTAAGAVAAGGDRGARREVRRVRGWCGGVDRFTPAAAADMIASLAGGYGVPLAAIRGGAVVRGALAPEVDVRLPGFPDRVTAYPFLSGEARRLAAELGAAELDWFNVFAGQRTLAALTRRATPAELVAAADADLAGRAPYQVLAVEIEFADPPATTALALRGADGYRLTAAVVTAAAHAVLNHAVPPGRHLAAEALDPAAVLDRAREHSVLTITDGPALVEEGAL